MEAIVLPLLTATILIAILWCSTRWLGKKEDRALRKFGEARDVTGNALEDDDTDEV